jgi:hypothetical protein
MSAKYGLCSSLAHVCRAIADEKQNQERSVFVKTEAKLRMQTNKSGKLT